MQRLQAGQLITAEGAYFIILGEIIPYSKRETGKWDLLHCTINQVQKPSHLRIARLRRSKQSINQVILVDQLMLKKLTKSSKVSQTTSLGRKACAQPHSKLP